VPLSSLLIATITSLSLLSTTASVIVSGTPVKATTTSISPLANLRDRKRRVGAVVVVTFSVAFSFPVGAAVDVTVTVAFSSPVEAGVVVRVVVAVSVAFWSPVGDGVGGVGTGAGVGAGVAGASPMLVIATMDSFTPSIAAAMPATIALPTLSFVNSAVSLTVILRFTLKSFAPAATQKAKPNSKLTQRDMVAGIGK